MLRKIPQYLFNNLEDSPLPGRIENLFPVVDVSLSGGNELDEKEELDKEEEELLDGDEDVMNGIEYEMIQMNSSENEGQPPRKRARQWQGQCKRRSITHDH